MKLYNFKQILDFGASCWCAGTDDNRDGAKMPEAAFDLEDLLNDFGAFCARSGRTMDSNSVAKWANEYVKQLKLK